MIAPQTRKTVGVLILSLALVYVLVAASSAPAGEPGSVTNESVTLQAGEWVALERAGSAHTSSNATISNATSGAAYAEGTDYEYNATDLSVKALSGGSISDGETVYASYEFRERSETHRNQTGVLARYSSLVSLGAWGGVALIILYAFRELSKAPRGGL